MEWTIIGAMGIGIVGSTVVHLSHGLMKLGLVRKRQGGTVPVVAAPLPAGLVISGNNQAFSWFLH